MIQPAVSRPMCGITHPSLGPRLDFYYVIQSRVCSCAELSLARGWVCCLQSVLGLASAVILESEPH
jgi:hypothetical protein